MIRTVVLLRKRCGRIGHGQLSVFSVTAGDLAATSGSRGDGFAIPADRTNSVVPAMVQPQDIRRKVENLNGDFLKTWLVGEDAFFPRVIPAR